MEDWPEEGVRKGLRKGLKKGPRKPRESSTCQVWDGVANGEQVVREVEGALRSNSVAGGRERCVRAVWSDLG